VTVCRHVLFSFWASKSTRATLRSRSAIAVLLGVVTAVQEVLTVSGLRGETGVIGEDACGQHGLVRAREFSIVIAGLGAGLEPHWDHFSAAYVLFPCGARSILVRAAK